MVSLRSAWGFQEVSFYSGQAVKLGRQLESEAVVTFEMYLLMVDFGVVSLLAVSCLQHLDAAFAVQEFVVVATAKETMPSLVLSLCRDLFEWKQCD